jgi:hypothetical protein
VRKHGVEVGDIRPRFGVEANTVELKGPSDGDSQPPSARK